MIGTLRLHFWAITGALTLTTFAVAGCTDQSGGNLAPPAPPSSTQTLGLFVGTYDDASHTIKISRAATGSVYGPRGTQAAVYGTLGTDINISVSQFSIDSTTRPGFKIYLFKVNLRNLLAWPIGSIDAGATPRDTIGIFTIFQTPPTITSPTPCVGCTISIDSTQGLTNTPDSLIGKPYYWYHDRPLAVQGTPGLDTTRNSPRWSVTATKAVTSWRFTFLVSAAWPPPHETQWTVIYNGAQDSLPSTAAEPRWKLATTTPLAVSWTPAGHLFMQAGNGGRVLFGRRDLIPLGPPATPSFVQARLRFTALSTAPDHILAIDDFVRYAALGIRNNRVGFDSLPTGTTTWRYQTGASVATGTLTNSTHSYRLVMYGQDSAVIYDGTTRLIAKTYATLPTHKFENTFFVAVYGNGTTESMTVDSVRYQVGGTVHP